MARLRTPGCTRATRLTGSTSRIRLNFARLSSTPSASGRAPPESPVPAPRADDRHFQASACPHHLLDLFDGVGQHRDERDLPVRGQAVALVGSQVLLGVEHRGVGEETTKRSEQIASAGVAGRVLVHMDEYVIPARPCVNRSAPPTGGSDSTVRPVTGILRRRDPRPRCRSAPGRLATCGSSPDRSCAAPSSGTGSRRLIRYRPYAPMQPCTTARSQKIPDGPASCIAEAASRGPIVSPYPPTSTSVALARDDLPRRQMVVGMRPAQRVQRHRHAAEQGGRGSEHAVRIDSAGAGDHRGGGGDPRRGHDDPAPVESVGEPADRPLQYQPSQQKHRDEQGDTVNREPDLGAVHRAHREHGAVRDADQACAGDTER